jgi:hypothetical protein
MAITLLTTSDGRPTNKVVTCKADGSLIRDMARNSGRFIARTVPAPDAPALANILREVGLRADTCLSLSLFQGAPEGEFVILPQAELAARLGVAPHEREALAGFHEIDGRPTAARIRDSMAPGPWLLFDRDQVDDMPPELAGLTFADWCAAIDLLFPGFATAGRVVLPSTTTRVSLDGAPLSSSSCHVFVQVNDPGDIGRAWPQACLRALITEYQGAPLGFAKPKRSKTTGEIVAIDWWTIYDKSVASPARLVFDGAPIVRGKGLKVLSPMVEQHDGPAIDLTQVRDLMPRKEKGMLEDAIEQIRGTRPIINLTRGRSGKVSGVEVITADLTMEIELETPAGPTTVGALHATGAGHTRCQSPFRESFSWAAFYNVHGDGVPFVYDTGTNEKHILATEGCAQMWAIIHAWLLERYQPRFQYTDGSIFSERRNEQEKVRQRDARPTPEIIDRMALASDAPRDRFGAVKRLALLTQFAGWLSVAWAVMLDALPLETEASFKSERAKAEFEQQVGALLHALVPGERTTSWGKRAVGTWCHWFATHRPGEWCRAGSLLAWGRLLDDTFQVALHQGLAEQVSKTAHRAIADMGAVAFGQRCASYGIAVPGDHRFSFDAGRRRVIVLTPEFVGSLLLATDHGDPLAEGLHYGLDASRPGKSPSGKH